ncbi:hypothetical protein [Clostridium nigeriense]|uniref:hypothetical protein n=1 Tax=Clostridium nigeriense TaxID=1805470 RepID=UPI0013563D44|nr:hypothetical protein [Clostridium nigeriense]
MKSEILNKYIEKLERNNCKITSIVNDPVYLNGKVKPSCFLEFIYEGYIYLTILEIDLKGRLSAFTINNTYEELYKHRKDFNEFRDTFPILIIVEEKKSIRYNSKNFEVIYTDLEFSNLEKFLF